MPVTLVLVLFAAILFALFCIAFNSRNSLHRVHHDEWTKFDELGRPVCGVGYRGYWVNQSTFGEPTFRQKKDGSWVSTKTGEPVEVTRMSLKELMEQEIK